VRAAELAGGARIEDQGRLLHHDWDLYDTRHVVYQPAKLTPEALEAGYWRAYKQFYRWSSILRAASTKDAWGERMRHVAYAGAWKRLEPMWDLIIRAKRASAMLPVLETTLAAFGARSSRKATREQRDTTTAALSAPPVVSVVDHLHARDEERVGSDRLLDLLT
jgi:hypothetical protein